ncbi:hypothetical protein MRX96_029749 [Rhipicephalus microplus]
MSSQSEQTAELANSFVWSRLFCSKLSSFDSSCSRSPLDGYTKEKERDEKIWKVDLIVFFAECHYRNDGGARSSRPSFSAALPAALGIAESAAVRCLIELEIRDTGSVEKRKATSGDGGEDAPPNVRARCAVVTLFAANSGVR